MNIEKRGVTEFNGIPSTDYDECMLWSSPSGEQPVIRGQFCTISTQTLIPRDYHQELNNTDDTLIITMINKSNEYRKKNDASYTSQGQVKFSKSSIGEIFEIYNWFRTNDMIIPTGLCVPMTCSPSDIENAINQGKYYILQF